MNLSSYTVGLYIFFCFKLWQLGSSLFRSYNSEIQHRIFYSSFIKIILKEEECFSFLTCTVKLTFFINTARLTHLWTHWRTYRTPNGLTLNYVTRIICSYNFNYINWIVCVSSGATTQSWSGPYYWGFVSMQNDTPWLVGILGTRKRSVAETSTWHTKMIKRQISVPPAEMQPAITARKNPLYSYTVKYVDIKGRSPFLGSFRFSISVFWGKVWWLLSTEPKYVACKWKPKFMFVYDWPWRIYLWVSPHLGFTFFFVFLYLCLICVVVTTEINWTVVTTYSGSSCFSGSCYFNKYTRYALFLLPFWVFSLFTYSYILCFLCRLCGVRLLCKGIKLIIIVVIIMSPT